MRLRFVKDVTTKEAKPRSFKKGQEVEFADDEHGRASAQHWLNRGAAVDLEEEESRDQPERPQKLRAGEVKVGAPPAEGDEGKAGEESKPGPAGRSGGFGGPVKGADKPAVVASKSDLEPKDAHGGPQEARKGK